MIRKRKKIMCILASAFVTVGILSANVSANVEKVQGSNVADSINSSIPEVVEKRKTLQILS